MDSKPYETMIDEKKLSDMKTWAGILGILMIISGVLSAIFGIFFFIVGAIPGIITIVLGLKLRDVQRYAEEILHSGDQAALNPLIGSLGSFFKIQGVLIIVIFVFILLVFLLALLGSFAYMGFNTVY